MASTTPDLAPYPQRLPAWSGRSRGDAVTTTTPSFGPAPAACRRSYGRVCGHGRLSGAAARTGAHGWGIPETLFTAILSDALCSVLRDRFSGPDFTQANLTPWGYANAFSTLADLIERHSSVRVGWCRGGRYDGVYLVQDPKSLLGPHEA